MQIIYLTLKGFSAVLVGKNAFLNDVFEGSCFFLCVFF